MGWTSVDSDGRIASNDSQVSTRNDLGGLRWTGYRKHGIQKVRGSNPLGSTKFPNTKLRFDSVGCSVCGGNLRSDMGWHPGGAIGPASSTAQIVATLLGEHAMTAIDVGARWGSEDAWWRVEPLAGITGFELDSVECDRLNATAGPHDRFVPAALGARRGTATLNLTKNPACSSLYPPIVSLIERYPALDVMRPVGQRPVDVITLAEWWNGQDLPPIGFMKLDTQGSELDILVGAGDLLTDCLGVEVEAEFSQLYEGQPVFADIDQYLRRRGFVLWRLSHRCHYAEGDLGFATGHESAHFGGIDFSYPTGSGRLFWADAIYFRDYSDIRRSESRPRKLLLLASLLSAVNDREAAAACLFAAVTGWSTKFSQSQRLLLDGHLSLLTSRQR